MTNAQNNLVRRLTCTGRLMWYPDPRNVVCWRQCIEVQWKFFSLLAIDTWWRFGVLCSVIFSLLTNLFKIVYHRCIRELFITIFVFYVLLNIFSIVGHIFCVWMISFNTYFQLTKVRPASHRTGRCTPLTANDLSSSFNYIFHPTSLDCNLLLTT